MFLNMFERGFVRSTLIALITTPVPARPCAAPFAPPPIATPSRVADAHKPARSYPGIDGIMFNQNNMC